MALLTKTEREAIEQRISQAEKKTSGEIVVSVVPSSGGYAWIPWVICSIGIAIPSLAIGIASFTQWEFSALSLLELQLFGACIGFGLGLIPGVRRIFVSQKTRAMKVHRQSLYEFVNAGVAQTKDRTGILVFVSEFEHRVEIVADQGIHEKLGPKYWEDQVAHIIQGIRAGRAATAIGDAVDQMGEKLVEHFPARPGDRNELSNQVRSDKPQD